LEDFSYASGGSLFEKSSAKTFRLPPPFLSALQGLREKEAAYPIKPVYQTFQKFGPRQGRRRHTQPAFKVAHLAAGGSF